LRIFFLTFLYQCNLGVYFKLHPAIYDLHTGRFHFFGPSNIVGFVKPGFQFNDYVTFFPFWAAVMSACAMADSSGNAIDRQVYTFNCRIQCCLIGKIAELM
jgi:hypothetical protein